MIDVVSSQALGSLEPPWQCAFEEAWESFRNGNFGIGAVLVDASDGSIVVTGRNRVAQTIPEPRTLSGNMTAHAEMNAFATLDRFDADGLHLYTTLEPCLMCMATAMQLNVAHIHFAAVDEFYVGMNDLWSKHPVTAERQPPSTGPLPDALARFARLLPMIFTLRHFPGRTAEQTARSVNPELAARAEAIDHDDVFQRIVTSGTVEDALDHLRL